MRVYLQLISGVMLLLLTACADTEWPQWISGEPTKEQLDAYKGPIPMPDGKTDGKSWPNLADVPQRPKVILKEDDKNALVAEMKEENTQGLAEIAAYNEANPPIVKPSVKPIAKPAPKPVAKKVVKKKKKKPSDKKKVTHHE